MYKVKSISNYLESKMKFIIFLCILAFTFLLFFWNSMVITIFSGHSGVKFSRLSGGIVMDQVYNPGLYTIFPWDTLTIYNTRIQENTQSVEVLTNKGIRLVITTSLRYQPIRDKLPILHANIGSDYVNIILQPIVTSVMRQTIGQLSIEDIYSPKIAATLEDLLIIRTIKAMTHVPISIQAIVIKEIALPQSLAEAIEKKVIAEHNILTSKHLSSIAIEEATRLNIEGEGIKRYQQLVNAHMTPHFLQYEAIKAQTKLAASQNAKMVILGKGGDSTNPPLILNMNESTTPQTNTPVIFKEVVNTPIAPQAENSSQNNLQENSPKAKTTDPSTLESFTNFIKRLDKILQN